jgi:hypothetical protein
MGQSRRVILIVVSALTFVAPLAMCLAVVLAPVRSVFGAAAIVIGATAWMTLLVLANWWEFTSIHLRWFWAIALAAATVYRARDAVTMPLASAADLPILAAALVLGGASTWAVVLAIAARRPQADPIDLSFPLSAGRFLVTDGGDGARSFLINYHYGFGRHRASGASASMRYAMDVVLLGAGGRESRGFLPKDNQAYRIWNRTLRAPCDAQVAHVVDSIGDNTAFGPDRPYGVGNHVVLRRGTDEYIVLGHLAQHSVRVGPGATVRQGDELGRVGNSGWTERPHLHMQAMRSANADWWHGDPIPMRFSGRFLVRNQVLRAPDNPVRSAEAPLLLAPSGEIVAVAASKNDLFARAATGAVVDADGAGTDDFGKGTADH